MDKIFINFEITGCLCNCYHCHCDGGAKNKGFMTIDDVISLASKFRESLDTTVSVRLVQEQTYYPDFFDMIITLENHGFMEKGNRKMLVSNCWGLANRDGFVNQLKNHFGVVKTTLFGIGKTHDIHAGRKGSYDDIIKATRLCLEQDIDIVWQVMLTQKNAEEIDQLYEIARDLGVEKIFTTCEHYYAGRIQDSNRIKNFFPQESNLKNLKVEVFEAVNGVLKPEKEYIDDIKKDIQYDISRIDFNEVYIDRNYNVFPIFHISPDFLLGNAKKSFNKIIDQILFNKDIAPAIVTKNKLRLNDLIKKYADKDSNELHTPQSLFDKLSIRELHNC